jgi:hypothetical protein
MCSINRQGKVSHCLGKSLTRIRSTFWLSSSSFMYVFRTPFFLPSLLLSPPTYLIKKRRGVFLAMGSHVPLATSGIGIWCLLKCSRAPTSRLWSTSTLPRFLLCEFCPYCKEFVYWLTPDSQWRSSFDLKLSMPSVDWICVYVRTAQPLFYYHRREISWSFSSIHS